MDAQPDVSVIIPSKDRPSGVETLIGDLRRQDYPREKLDIVVVDDGSQPPYRPADEHIRVIRHESAQGAQKSRNEGLNNARGQIALIIDDDIRLLNDDYVSRAVEVLVGHPEVAAVVSRKIDVVQSNGRKKLLEFSTSQPTWYSGDLVKCDRPAGPIDWGHGIYFVRRAVLLELGCYDGIYGLNGGHSFREESDVHARLRHAGHELWYLPDIAIEHHMVTDGGHGASVGRRLYWIAHNHMVFLRRHLRCWPLRAVGFLFDVLRYSWVQGRLRYMGAMLRGYAAGWRNAMRDRGPGLNHWLERQ